MRLQICVRVLELEDCVRPPGVKRVVLQSIVTSLAIAAKPVGLTTFASPSNI